LPVIFPVQIIYHIVLYRILALLQKAKSNIVLHTNHIMSDKQTEAKMNDQHHTEEDIQRV